MEVAGNSDSDSELHLSSSDRHFKLPHSSHTECLPDVYAVAILQMAIGISDLLYKTTLEMRS